MRVEDIRRGDVVLIRARGRRSWVISATRDARPGARSVWGVPAPASEQDICATIIRWQNLLPGYGMSNYLVLWRLAELLSFVGWVFRPTITKTDLDDALKRLAVS